MDHFSLFSSAEKEGMGAAGIDIGNLLVHRDRMLLIRRIISVDGTRAVTLATVTDQWPLVDDSSANPLVLVEVAAQTAGVYNSWCLHRDQGPDADHRGWLVGVKLSHFLVPHIPLGTDIITEAQNQFEYESFREIRAITTIRGRTAADITLQIVQATPESE